MVKRGGMFGKMLNNHQGRKLVKRTIKETGAETAEQVNKITQEVAQQVQAHNAVIDARSGRNVKKSYKKSLKEAKRSSSNSADDTVSKAIEYESKARDASSFTYDGKQYTRTGDGPDSYQYYSRESKRDDWASVSSSDFDTAHTSYINEQAELGKQMDLDEAYKTATAGPGMFDGIPGWAKVAGVGAAAAVVGSSLLEDDDDNYY